MSTWFLTYGFAEVLDDLLIGAYPLDAEDVAMLERIGVERVLNLVEDSEYAEDERAVVEASFADAGIVEHRIELVDYGGLTDEGLDEAVDQILKWLEQGHRVYAHCRAGWQRSAAVAAGVVAIREDIDIVDALFTVRSRKPSADPLPHQREDLLRWWEQRSARGESAGGGGESPRAGAESEPAATESAAGPDSSLSRLRPPPAADGP